jgi:hypothetical protein
MELTARMKVGRVGMLLAFTTLNGSAMRALIALSLLGIVFGSRVCEAGMSDAPREVSAPTATHTAVAHHRMRGRMHHARRLAVRSLRSAARSVDYFAGSIFPIPRGLFQKSSRLPVAAIGRLTA